MDSPTEVQDDIYVTDISGGHGDGANVILAYNTLHLSISVLPSNGLSTQDTRCLDTDSRPLQDHIVDTLSRASICEDFDEYDQLVDEVLSVILEAGKHFFQQPTLLQARCCNIQTLHALLFPEFLYFRLEALGRDASLVPIEAREANIVLTIDLVCDQNFAEELEIDKSLPSYSPDEVMITELFLRGTSSVTAAVQVGDKKMFCKASGSPSGLFGTSEGRELEYLGKISKIAKISRQQETLRIPRIVGYIHHKETRGLLGFLRQWVPGRSLTKIDIESVSPEMRQRWSSQIGDMIKYLHEHGLIWGDARPSNIIIDEEDNAWLIDFGGGYTHGWTNKDFAETKEGDEQALAKIVSLAPGSFRYAVAMAGMRSQHHISITVPIPNRVPPEVVLAHIQKCTPLLEHNTVVTGYTEMSPDVALVMGDPFFGKPNSSIRTFLSHERIHLAPGLTRERSWPVTCLSIPNGIRWRANASAGVTVWTEWVVRPRQDMGTPSSAGTLTEEWELYEEVTIEANKLIMPFVSRTADGVHRTICQKVVDEVVDKYLAKQVPSDNGR
ncbi:hypothetical protein FGRMN_920 [Fusarium graminum]|nr:hypothetical protein FGRMN_920 [Fusarium graminum]